MWLSKQKDIQNIRSLYYYASDRNFIVALKDFQFYYMKKRKVVHLTTEEAIKLSKKEPHEFYEEYNMLYPSEKTENIEEKNDTTRTKESI